MTRPAVPSAAERLRPWLQDARLRDPQVWRLVSGLILLSFALTHFLNHALGHISVETMEEVQAVRRAFWRSWPGTVLLYGALAVHVSLALAKLIRRRTWRLAPWEIVQIVLGLAIPFMAAAHVAATRGLNSLYGFDDTYGAELTLLWPGLAFSQSLLLVVVWLHAMIGLHFWLRTKPWYRTWSPTLLVAAVLIPTLSITGFVESARRVSLMTFGAGPFPPGALERSTIIGDWARTGVWTAFGVTVLTVVAHRLWDMLPCGLV